MQRKQITVNVYRDFYSDGNPRHVAMYSAYSGSHMRRGTDRAVVISSIIDDVKEDDPSAPADCPISIISVGH